LSRARLTAFDARNLCLGYAVLFCQLALPYPGRSGLSDYLYLAIRYFGVVVFIAARKWARRKSSLADGVLGILLVCAQKQVRRIAAHSVIAAV
jgi:hypothetical protein